MKVGINGMGRMGRLSLRAAMGGVHRTSDDPRAGNRLDIVHVNEIKGGAAATAHLLEFDSIHGRWRETIAADGENGFLIPIADVILPDDVKDDREATALLDVLENTVVPMYYDQPKQFLKVVKTAMKDVEPEFESTRMAREYYEQLYKI